MKEKIANKHIDVDNLDLIYIAQHSQNKDYVVFCSNGKESAIKHLRDDEKPTIDVVKTELQDKGYENFASLPGCLINMDHIEYFCVSTTNYEHSLQVLFENGNSFNLSTSYSETETINNYNALAKQCNAYDNCDQTYALIENVDQEQ